MDINYKLNRYSIKNLFLGLNLVLAFMLNSLAFDSVFLFILLLGLLIIIFYPSTSKVKANATLFFLLLFILTSLNLINFNFIPQALVLLERNTSLSYWFMNRHEHAVRLLIVYPSYLISKNYNVPLNFGFSLYTILFFLLMYLNMANILKIYTKKIFFSNQFKLMILTTVLTILSFLMNGRIVFAFTGFSLLIYLNILLFSGKQVKKILIIVLTLLGLVLSMVSSGTMVVALLYIIIMLVYLNKNNNIFKFLKRNFFYVLILLPFVVSMFRYYEIMVLRNIIYFGGGLSGVFNMLNHGIGRFFTINPFIFSILLILGLIIVSFNILFIYNKFKKIDYNFPIILGINISIYGLLFGFSTGLMMICPLILYILLKI